MTVEDLLASHQLVRLLEPFAAIDRTLTLRLEDAAGRAIATAGAPIERRGGERASRDILVGGNVGGRLVVLDGAVPAGSRVERDRSATGSIAAALAEAIGTSLELLLEEATARRAAERDKASAGAGAAEEPAAGGSRLDAELALARQIQRSFVPLTSPDVPGYEIASHYEAAREVGGDFFDIFKLRGGSSRLAVVIADVTGKGIAAALLMAFARPLLHSAIDHTGVPTAALERINRILVEERRSGLFITALCAILEVRSGRLHVGNAGHEPPLVVPADGGPIRWLPGSGPLLGAFRELGLSECVTDLEEGDLVILYTDGVTDARAASGERFGDGRLVAVIDANRARRPVEVVAALTEAVREHQAGMPPADDVTIVAIRRLPGRRRKSASTG